MNEDTFESISYYGIPLEQVRTGRQAIVKDIINDFTKANNGEECPIEFITKLIYL